MNASTAAGRASSGALMPAEASRWLAGTLPQARLHLLADCGHAVFLSQPAACAALIRSFLDD